VACGDVTSAAHRSSQVRQVLPAQGGQHHLVHGSDTYPARVGDRPLRKSPQVEEGGVVPAADLVLEGGGLKGLGGAGAVLGLMAQGYTFPRVAGTSAGAIVGAFAAAGASPTRLEQLMSELDYRKVPDRSGFKLPLLSEGLSLFLDGGAYEGDYIHNWLRTELKALGVETFGQLRRADRDDDVNLPVHQRYKLVVTATDVTRGRLLRLPWDYEQFGLDPDTQLVADAVRASMSIPLYFEPQQLRNPQTGETSTIVDGGVLTNFPVEIFDRTDPRPRRWPTFGVRIMPDMPPAGGGGLLPGWLTPKPLHLVEQVITTAIVGHDQTYVDRPCVRKRTITVDTSPVGVVEFGASAAQREQVSTNGRRAAAEFLSTWDWDAYRAHCPAG